MGVWVVEKVEDKRHPEGDWWATHLHGHTKMAAEQLIDNLLGDGTPEHRAQFRVRKYVPADD